MLYTPDLQAKIDYYNAIATLHATVSSKIKGAMEYCIENDLNARLANVLVAKTEIEVLFNYADIKEDDGSLESVTEQVQALLHKVT